MGTWLSIWLNFIGAKVIGYSQDPPTIPSMFDTLHLETDIIHIRGDVCDKSYLESCILQHQPEIIFHLAAQPLVRLSYEKPLETFHTNIIGTASLLEAVRNTISVKACIIMTSDKCYENKEIDYAYQETDPMGGNDPYSASKGAAELIVSSYRKSFFDPEKNNHCKASLSTIRAGNIVGGGDWANDRLIPDCIRSISSKQPLRIRHPNAIRPWQYVLEPISGMLLLSYGMLTQPKFYAGPWNFGPNAENEKITVSNLARKVINEWGDGSFIDISQENIEKMYESSLLLLDSNKARNFLGWRPIYSIDEAVSETLSWYRSYFNKMDDMKQFSISKIERYVKRAEQMNMTWTKATSYT